MLAIGRASALRRLGRRPFPSGLYLLNVFDERTFGAPPGPQTACGQHAYQLSDAHVLCSLMLFAPLTQASAAAVDLAPGGFQRQARCSFSSASRSRSPPHLATVRAMHRGSPCVGVQPMGRRSLGWRPTRAMPLARRLLIFGWPTVLAGLASSRSPCSAIRARAPRRRSRIACSRFSRSFGGCVRPPSAPRCCTARRSRPRLRCAAASKSRCGRARGSSSSLMFELTATVRAVPHGAEPSSASGGAARRGAWRVASMCGLGRARGSRPSRGRSWAWRRSVCRPHRGPVRGLEPNRMFLLRASQERPGAAGGTVLRSVHTCGRCLGGAGSVGFV